VPLAVDDVTLIQEALLVAVQAQPVPAVTLTVPVPAEAERLTLAEDIE